MITAPRFFLYRAALNLACGLGALACLIPAIDVNLVAHFARGGAWYEAAIFVVSVIAASAATIALRGAIERCDVSMGFIAGLILIAALAFNLTNALASSRLIRAHFAEPRADIAKKIAALKAERTEILGSLGSASGPSVEEVEAELQKLEANLLFARSKQCRDVTLGDSSAYCAHRADVLGKLAAARERAAKLQRLDEIRDRLAQLPAAPEVIDPKVDSLIAILSGLGWAKEAERGRIGLAIDVLTALFVELLAAFGPSIFLYARPAMRSAPEAAPMPAINEKPSPSKIDARIPADLRAFLEGRVLRREGGRVSAEELCAAFNAAHSDRLYQIKPATLGKAINALYRPAKDQAAKNAVYLGIELLPENATKLSAMKGR